MDKLNSVKKMWRWSGFSSEGKPVSSKLTSSPGTVSSTASLLVSPVLAICPECLQFVWWNSKHPWTGSASHVMTWRGQTGPHLIVTALAMLWSTEKTGTTGDLLCFGGDMNMRNLKNGSSMTMNSNNHAYPVGFSAPFQSSLECAVHTFNLHTQEADAGQSLNSRWAALYSKF